MNCSPPGFSVHGISRARIPEWVAISFSRGSSLSRDRTHVSCIGRQILYHRAIREAQIPSICCKQKCVPLEGGGLSLFSHLSNGDNIIYLETRSLWKLNGKKKKNWGEWTVWYNIDQSPNSGKALEAGSALVVREAGNLESEWLCSPVCKELGRLKQAAFLLGVHLSSPECLCVHTWGCARKPEGRMEGGNPMGLGTVGWDCLPPLAWASPSAFVMVWDLATVS